MEWDGGFRWVLWPFFGVFAIVALVVVVFDVLMLVDAIQRPPERYSSRDAKTWWIAGLIVGLATGLPAIAVAIAYYILVKRPGERDAPVVADGPMVAPGAPGAPPVPTPQQIPPTNCRNCGAKLVAGARFCHSCGASTV